MQFIIKAFVTMFTVIDPVGLVPVVLALTAGLAPQERTTVITRAIVIASIVILVFGLAGQAIFTALGVTAEAFSIAGGVLLFLVAIDMLFGRQSGTRETPREAREARTRDDVSIPACYTHDSGARHDYQRHPAGWLNPGQSAATGRHCGGHRRHARRRLVCHARQPANSEARRHHWHPRPLARAGHAAGGGGRAVHPEWHRSVYPPGGRPLVPHSTLQISPLPG